MTTIENQAANTVTTFFKGLNQFSPVKSFKVESEVAKDRSGRENEYALMSLQNNISKILSEGWKVITYTDLKVTEGESTFVIECQMISIPV